MRSTGPTQFSVLKCHMYMYSAGKSTYPKCMSLNSTFGNVYIVYTGLYSLYRYSWYVQYVSTVCTGTLVQSGQYVQSTPCVRPARSVQLVCQYSLYGLYGGTVGTIGMWVQSGQYVQSTQFVCPARSVQSVCR